MAGWVDPDDGLLSSVTALARELADPVRLTALQLLAAEGPHTMIQLADAIGVSAPRLGNHLAQLRAAGLVAVEHTGRHAVYRLGRAGLGEVLTALARYANDRDLTLTERPTSPIDLAHTCYDHVAGRLGVAVFALLVERSALRPPDGSGDELALGEDTSAFAALGVDPTAIEPGRRKLATACLDKSHRLPHLGGVLGRAVLDALLADDLVRRRDDTRELLLTDAGRSRLPALLPDFGQLLGSA
ncbi:helix-turn-helix transcriptional regulator [Kutzneria buriramensis]|uniref:DNA-binding transcriptional ArsR family regulator n=1 Tax=Kutzneria buriramensis TaxID=1045776 RepID=A0A3E0H7H9_9PSEU|nr:helix-turn-helix transcriptional regulator [Kutzneria buriramensis]REH39278.1 DNA-binding transcriptional ArsR family regulator [Kutzneria buriramensis]